jgi:large subunit ribosomal protein L7/L12
MAKKEEKAKKEKTKKEESTTEEQKDLPELSKNGEKVLELVEGMTVLEMADLVKVMEDKFGVSAAAPVAAAAAPTGGAEEEKEEKSAYDIELKDAGDSKIDVIKVVKEITGEGLMEAKKMAEEGGTIKEGVPTEEAEELKSKLEEAGATVELK